MGGAAYALQEDGNTRDLKAVPYGGAMTAQVLSSTSAKIPFNDASNSDAVRILCKAGTAAQAAANDRGGGFYFGPRNGLTSDGTNLYIGNYYNIRVDKYTMNGALVEAFSTRTDTYTRQWSSDPATISSWGNVGCSFPTDIELGGDGFIYGSVHNTCSGDGGGAVLFKVNATTGTMYGWKGSILPGNSPSGGEAGCSGANISTPAWCQGGRSNVGYRLGQFSADAHQITLDNHFVYVTDEANNRVTRIPK